MLFSFFLSSGVAQIHTSVKAGMSFIIPTEWINLDIDTAIGK